MFVVQNCSAFNDNLLDSELFGHMKGSFTGAVSDKKGLFEVADQGTFFLDEIGDMSPALQVKLLRVLQEGTFIGVGDTKGKKVDVRILAATNKDLKELVEKGLFREDLYYRVNVITVRLPSLRERKEDIPLLIDHFLFKYTQDKGIRKRLSKKCMEKFFEYDWPGNIRELENEIERLVVLSDEDPVISDEMISPRILDRIRSTRSNYSAASSVSTEAIRTGVETLPDAVENLEREIIEEGLKKTRWNKSKLARQLGISRRNLIRKIEKYALDKRKRL
jgi:transcriptional regulator with PAS, ATPase and Fis domain